MIDALRDLLEAAELRHGLVPGALATAVGLATALVWRRVRGHPAPIAGLLLATAALAGLSRSQRMPDAAALGVVLLAGGAAVASLSPRPALLRILLAAPGAWLLATDGELPGEWVPATVALTAVLGGALVADADRRHQDRGWGPALVPLSALGVYATVPDTEEALVLVGASLPVALLGWPWSLASLGGPGAYAVAGLLAWVVATGGAGRQSSIVGGMACLGLLVAEPVARVLLKSRRPSRRRSPWPGLVPALAVHAVLVGVAARVAGLRPTVGAAVTVVAAELVAAVFLLAAIGASRPPPGVPRPAGRRARRNGR